MPMRVAARTIRAVSGVGDASRIHIVTPAADEVVRGLRTIRVHDAERAGARGVVVDAGVAAVGALDVVVVAKRNARSRLGGVRVNRAEVEGIAAVVSRVVRSEADSGRSRE